MGLSAHDAAHVGAMHAGAMSPLFLAHAQEVWELLWGSEPAGIAQVDLSADQRYEVALQGVAPDALPPGLEPDERVASSDVTARSCERRTGGGLPVFELGISTAECGGTGDPNFIECPTVHTEFGFGATYRLLLESDGAGGLDPEGMALGFDVSYTWLVFDVGSNPTYEGHGYQGVAIGVGYSTPLGLPELRLDASLAYTQALTFGKAEMIANWGQSASGFGLGGALEVGYEIFAGLFAELGYSGQFFSTSYDGTGCQGLRDDNTCAINPHKSVASDQFHQGIIRLGYRLH